MPLLIRWLINAAALVLAATLLGDDVRLAGFGSALAAAALIGLLNVVIKPFLLLLTLPLNVLTLGLFTFVINAVIILIASTSNPAGWFYVSGFWPALGVALILSIVSWVMNYLTGSNERPQGRAFFYYRRGGQSGGQQGPFGPQGQDQNRPGPRPRVSSDEDTIDLNQDSDGKWK